MEWFKFYGGAYLSDPKMLMLTACERSCWLTLLAYASVSENGGKVKYLTEQQLMIAAGVSPMHEEWDITVGVLAKFDGLDMISLEKDEIEVLNWGKRQESYLSNAERQRKYREKVKSNADVTTPLQQSNARIRIEENRIDTSVAIAPQVVEIVSEVSEKKSTPKKYPHSKEVFGLWGSYPRNWELNTTQLRAAENLFEEQGIEEIKGALDYWKKHKDEDFCPQVPSPYDLDSKWLKLSAFYDKQHAS